MTRALFPSRRVCVVCGCDAPNNKKRIESGQVSILSLSMTFYRRVRGSRKQYAVRAVRVCEPCAALIMAEGQSASIKGRLLADALLSAFSARFGSVLDQDAIPPALDADSRAKFRELFREGQA